MLLYVSKNCTLRVCDVTRRWNTVLRIEPASIAIATSTLSLMINGTPAILVMRSKRLEKRKERQSIYFVNSERYDDQKQAVSRAEEAEAPSS